MIPIIAVIIAISLAIGIGLGIRISTSKEENTDIEYCTECPMCGWLVELKPINDYWYIECQNLACGLHTGHFENKERLIKKWNNMCQKINNTEVSNDEH
jgi:hypothetical protein